MGKQNIVIIASDHTRPVPSKIIMPLMLEEIRKGNPDAKITILIATGFHRNTTEQELINKFGNEIVKNETIIVHDCTDDNMMINLGKLPSGGDFIVNKIAVNADLLVSEGFIEPHFFAGFSGGRKSVLPGVVSRTTVLANHCSKFIADENARAGILENNPIHTDMIFGAKKAKLAFIVNVVINHNKDIVYAVAGDCDLAHQQGCEFLSGLCKVTSKPADIVITTNGGYPLDQNIYQAVKGMTAAEAIVKQDGVIIMAAKSNDGHGGEEFYQTFKNEKNLDVLERQFLNTAAENTIPDQWESQILVRILKRAKVIYVSDADENLVKDMHLIPAKNLDEALDLAIKILNNPNATISVIPDGVGTIVSVEK